MISVSPLVFRLEVAAKDATVVVVVMKLRASDCASGVPPSKEFGRQ